MKVSLYQVDAFAESCFQGNPAAVCPLNTWLDDDILQNIAAENNLSETAFFVQDGSDFHLRWFTPVLEIDLCGHATLASAHVIYNHLGYREESINFHTRSGLLTVKQDGEYLSMNFPSWEPTPIDPPKELILGLGTIPKEIFKSRDYLAVFNSEKEVRNLDPDFHILSGLDVLGIIATAPGDSFDFISRFFAPNAGVNEDPVTGSAHSTLVPYWSRELNKNSLKAKQISARGGILHCQMLDGRVIINGKALTYLEGIITF